MEKTAAREGPNPYWRSVFWAGIAIFIGALVATGDLFDFPGKCIDILGSHAQAVWRPYWNSLRAAMFNVEVKLVPVAVVFLIFGAGMLWELRKSRKAHAEFKDKAHDLDAHGGRLATLEKERDELRHRLEGYEQFAMELDSPFCGYENHMWAARISVSHTGKRTVETTVEIVGLSPIKGCVDPLLDFIQTQLPFRLPPKSSLETKFDLHTQSAKEVDVAYLEQLRGNKPHILLGDFSGRHIVPALDYIVVLSASGRHATPTWVAFTLGDQVDDSADTDPDQPKSKLVFKRLPKPIGDVLGHDDPLAKRWDPKIAPHPLNIL